MAQDQNNLVWLDMEMTGFSAGELERLAAWEPPNAGLTDENATPEAPKDPTSKPGDLWQFQLSYYDYGPEGTEPELGSCAPLTVPNYHRYEDYAGLRFEGGK